MMSTEQENVLRIKKWLAQAPLISTGQPSTLGTYKGIAKVFGKEAEAFIDEKIAKHERGMNEIVIADESQMLFLFSIIQKLARENSDEN